LCCPFSKCFLQKGEQYEQREQTRTEEGLDKVIDQEDIRADGLRWDQPFTNQVESHTCFICDEQHYLNNGMWLSFFGHIRNSKDEEKANKRFHLEVCT